MQQRPIPVILLILYILCIDVQLVVLRDCPAPSRAWLR